LLFPSHAVVTGEENHIVVSQPVNPTERSIFNTVDLNFKTRQICEAIRIRPKTDESTHGNYHGDDITAESPPTVEPEKVAKLLKKVANATSGTNRLTAAVLITAANQCRGR